LTIAVLLPKFKVNFAYQTNGSEKNSIQKSNKQ